jgi:hypothetical protein
MPDSQVGITRLESFMKANDIRPVELARVSDVSRQHLTRVRAGRMEPTRRVMTLIRFACCFILHRKVAITELFDFNDWSVVRPKRRSST